MNNHKQACELGETALSDALEKIDDVDEETFRDAKSIIELLKENLSLWKEEEEQNNVEDLWVCWFDPLGREWRMSFNEMLSILSVYLNSETFKWVSLMIIIAPLLQKRVVYHKLMI